MCIRAREKERETKKGRKREDFVLHCSNSLLVAAQGMAEERHGESEDRKWKRKEERDGNEATIARKQALQGPRAFYVCFPIPRAQLLWSGDTNYILAYILVASISLFHTSQELTTAPSHSRQLRLLDTVVLIIGAALFVAVFNRIVIETGCDLCWFCREIQNCCSQKHLLSTSSSLLMIFLLIWK